MSGMTPELSLESLSNKSKNGDKIKIQDKSKPMSFLQKLQEKMSQAIVPKGTSMEFLISPKKEKLAFQFNFENHALNARLSNYVDSFSKQAVQDLH